MNHFSRIVINAQASAAARTCNRINNRILLFHFQFAASHRSINVEDSQLFLRKSNIQHLALGWLVLVWR
jgi:hypothetical protein